MTQSQQSVPEISSFCSALQQSLVADNKQRSEAEQYLQQVKLIPGSVQHFLAIAIDQQSQQNGTQHVSQQAALFLKHLIVEHWKGASAVDRGGNFSNPDDKENASLHSNSPSNPNMKQGLKPALNQLEKEYLFGNILSALDQSTLQEAQVNSQDAKQDSVNKIIVSSIQNVIYNMSQLDYPQWNGVQSFDQLEKSPTLSPLHQQIAQRLQCEGTPDALLYKISGLRALKSVVDALEEQSDDVDRKPLYHLAEVFFPVIEASVLSDASVNSSPHYVDIMVQVCKIFYVVNRHAPSPYLLKPGKMGPWVQLFTQILDTDLGPQYETPLFDHDQIQAMNKQPCWRLKNIVAETCKRLFQNYIQDVYRSGIQKSKTGKKELDRFHHEFQANYAKPLGQSFVNLLLRVRTQFVSTKALNCAIRMITTITRSMKVYKKVIWPHLQTILFEVSLPLLLTSQKEVMLWKEDPVEYVRLQVDFANSWNVRRANSQMIKTICGIKANKKQKIGQYLTSYLNLICEQLQQINSIEQSGQPINDEQMRQKEALMHAFGLLPELMAKDEGYKSNAESMLQQFVYQELTSPNPFLRARACQVYGQFGNFPLQDNHIKQVLEALFQSLQDNELPVRVSAAVSLIQMLGHEIAQEIVRPALGQIIRIYIKLIDDIEYDELIKGVKTIVEVFESEIAPYALDLCKSFSESYLKLLEQIKTQGKTPGEEIEVDNETSLTLDGLFTALRRVLQSISGKFPAMYPELETHLIKPIYEAMMHCQGDSTQGACMQEALTCLAELLYNMEHPSENMWQFFKLIVSSFIGGSELFDEHMSQTFVVLINFLNKASEFMKTNSFELGGQQMTYIESLCQLVLKTFECGRDAGQEFLSISAISLGNAILENVKQAPAPVVPGLVAAYLNEISQGAETPDFNLMLLQGLLMCLWYDCPAAVAALEAQPGASSHFLEQVFKCATELENDFEVKRFTMGLTALLQPMSMPDVYTQNYQNVMKCLVYLCNKSVQMRTEVKPDRRARNEECEEDHQCCEDDIDSDEEGDYEIDLDSDEDEDGSAYNVDSDEDEGGEGRECLYVCPLDEVDEVLHFADALQSLQTGEGQMQQMFTYLMAQLSEQEINQLNQVTSYAQQEKQHQLQQLQQQ